MVFYFTSDVVDPPAMIYMGKDKFENEDLIKYGFPEDVWLFHVDKLSSAHVYIRLGAGQTWDQIPEALLQDCAQLVKANSIEGNKKDNITIVYTPWENLKKTAGMEVGQVSFNKSNQVKRIHVQTRVNAIVNRLNKTKQELYPDLAEQRIERDKKERLILRKAELQKREEENNLAEEKRKAKQDIDNLFSEANMTSNYRETEVEDVNAWEEDFM